MNAVLRLLDGLLFPDAGRCPVCGAECAFGICPDCSARLDHLRLEGRTGVFRYDDIVRGMVLRYKFEGEKYLCGVMARLMLPAISDTDADMMTFVPVHKKRRRERGYDQSALLARELSELTGIPCARLINKDVHTRPQSTLSMEERLLNAAGKYSLAGKKDIRGKRVIVADDVLTTGATMRECCALLEGAGAIPIPLTFAQAVNEDKPL